MNLNRILRNISFVILAVITAVLAVLTLGIHLGWSECLYTSWPIVTLWSLAAASSIVLIMRTRLYRRLAVFAIHLSLLLILAGACVTHYCSISGTMHLRVEGNTVQNVKIVDETDYLTLPQGVALKRFDVVTYPATDTPRDFECTIVSDKGLTTEVSMNNPGRMMGWTFVMEGYDDDGCGVTFNVSHDKWGVGLSYAGYLMLMLSFISYFFAKNSSWRISLRQLTVLLLMLVAFPVSAKVGKDFSDDFGKVLINYNGRICPMTTVAKDFTTNLTGGSASYGIYDMESVLAGFIFDFGEWKHRPVIRVKNKELKSILQICGSYVSYTQFFDAISTGKINLDDRDVQKKFSTEIDRFETVNMLVSGELLKIFPVSDSVGNITWLSPTDGIPAYVEGDKWLFIRKYLGLLNEQVQRNDIEQEKYLLDALLKYQNSVLGNNLPSDSKIRMERCYDYLSSLRWTPIIVGIVGLMFFLFGVFQRETRGWFRFVGLVFAIIASVFLICMIMMRWIVSGHVPLSNGYETMQFLSWILLVIAILCRNSQLLLPMGILGSGLAWGVSVMSGSGSSVSGLMPVLNSPLLSVHVMLVMMSYALFLLMTLTGVAGVISKKDEAYRYAAMINVMLYPALALLAMGIFVGAVWANISWGRYWGWDPKEVWALITLLTYFFAAHPSLLSLFRKPRVLMWFSIIAFLTVLITYFGVNYVLGGLHSYA